MNEQRECSSIVISSLQIYSPLSSLSIHTNHKRPILLLLLILRLSKFTNRLSRISARLVNKSLDLSSNVGIGNWESLGSIRRTIIIIIIVVPRNDEVPQPEQWLWIIKIIVWPTCRGVTCTVHGIFMASQKAARERAYDLIHRNEPCIVRYPIRIIKSFEARTDAANVIIYRLWPCVKCWTRVEGKETWFEATRHEKESERLGWIFMQCRVRRKFSFLNTILIYVIIWIVIYIVIVRV